MMMTFMDLVKHIRKVVLEEGYNELTVEFNDDYISFRLYDCEAVYISYFPFECDCRGNNYKIVVGGIVHELEDMTELTELYKIVKIIEKFRHIIDAEVFDRNNIEEEADV